MQYSDAVLLTATVGIGTKASATPDTYALRVWDATTGDYYTLGTPTAQVAINGANLQVKP